ncbi:hypothetical protein DRJ16_01405 [Candidatus Woesearchaeota archaeon]|nr:MAG: hypothetical protein DRJ16_01405 [Candidatus Woesearchaeota archaeon]
MERINPISKRKSQYNPKTDTLEERITEERVTDRKYKILHRVYHGVYQFYNRIFYHIFNLNFKSRKEINLN